MELKELCQGLMEALERFDEEILPLGLYSSDEMLNAQGQRAQRLGQHQEESRAIVPFLLHVGGRRRPSGWGSWLWDFEGLPSVELKVVRIARIKVRRYGSGYQVDKHEHREQRWRESNLTGYLNTLTQPPADPDGELQARILLLIGFDKAAVPFGGKIHEMHTELRPHENGVCFQTRTWADKARRGFSIRLATWARTMPQR